MMTVEVFVAIHTIQISYPRDMVAKKLGRHYLGCELHENYGNLIEERVLPYENRLEKFFEDS